jgi:1-deoxy-D-xylulose-5-phosphate reductoisomerase
MGPKISVDSATLMNKGLELIEACHSVRHRPDAIRVVIHPQSIVHSLVEYDDGSVLARMSQPDMRVPIAHALGYPSASLRAPALDLVQIARLSFEEPDFERFPCLQNRAIRGAGPGHDAGRAERRERDCRCGVFLAGG